MHIYKFKDFVDNNLKNVNKIFCLEIYLNLKVYGIHVNYNFTNAFTFYAVRFHASLVSFIHIHIH